MAVGIGECDVNLRVAAVDAEYQRLRRVNLVVPVQPGPLSHAALDGICSSASTVTKVAPRSRSSSMMRGSAPAFAEGHPCISTIAPSPWATTPVDDACRDATG